MKRHKIQFLPLMGMTIAIHTVTYVIMGIISSYFLDYKSLFASPHMACWMRQFSDPVIMAAPLFQPCRGIVFALVIYAIHDIIFSRKYGWLVLSWVFIALGVLSTFGPAPGSLEGLVFTTIPLQHQLGGYLEVVPQACLLAYGVVYWIKHPDKKWFTWATIAAFIVAIGLPLIGIIST